MIVSKKQLKHKTSIAVKNSFLKTNSFAKK